DGKPCFPHPVVVCISLCLIHTADGFIKPRSSSVYHLPYLFRASTVSLNTSVNPTIGHNHGDHFS
ncbi:hypothetical protein ACN38_g8768, partial [Penicillium nordicum]